MDPATPSTGTTSYPEIQSHPSTPPGTPTYRRHTYLTDSSSPVELEPGSKLSSRSSLSTVHSSHSRKEYLDSLVVPPKEELQKIAEVQTVREAEHKRHSREVSREVLRKSLDIARSKRESRSDLDSHKSHMAQAVPPPQPPLAKAMSEHDEAARTRAAITIQRAYRGYRTRREMQGFGLDASTRWTYAIREAQWRELIRPRARSELDEGENGGGSSLEGASARQKWKKAAVIARHAGLDIDEDEESASSSSSDDDDDTRTAEDRREAKRRKEEATARRKRNAMTMGLPYFLEMVDLKHRYGSNLRSYHEEWKRSDTKENFFYWLDYGEGRYIHVEGCPRERLDREQVRYLSREERQYYLVRVDADGRLCWAKNGVRIDTTERWKDSIHGIVPADDPTPSFQPEHGPHDDDTESNSGSSVSESELERARAAKYATPGLDQAHGIKKIKHMSASTIVDKLLRKSVRKNTWIFVADTNFRLYVGIKSSGAFQHSSFLQGSRISAAGLIKIKNGRLSSLSPLSGHYRPPATNFRAFVHSLRDEGVDMKHVSISKSYAVLVGLEVYLKTRRKGKDIMKKLMHRKDKIMAPEEARRREEQERDKSESARKEREFLEKLRREEEQARDENSTRVRLLEKLKISPTEPAGGPEAERLEAAARE